EFKGPDAAWTWRRGSRLADPLHRGLPGRLADAGFVGQTGGSHPQAVAHGAGPSLPRKPQRLAVLRHGLSREARLRVRRCGEGDAGRYRPELGVQLGPDALLPDVLPQDQGWRGVSRSCRMARAVPAQAPGARARLAQDDYDSCRAQWCVRTA